MAAGRVVDEHVVSEGSGLSPTQTRVAHVFFSMLESDGFLLAGGAALLAHGLITRPTTDLDFFTAAAAGVQEAALAFAQVAAEQGWTVEINGSHRRTVTSLFTHPKQSRWT